jgi:hypothetical protein
MSLFANENTLAGLVAALAEALRIARETAKKQLEELT